MGHDCINLLKWMPMFYSCYENISYLDLMWPVLSVIINWNIWTKVLTQEHRIKDVFFTTQNQYFRSKIENWKICGLNIKNVNTRPNQKVIKNEKNELEVKPCPEKQNQTKSWTTQTCCGMSEPWAMQRHWIWSKILLWKISVFINKQKHRIDKKVIRQKKCFLRTTYC